jgi:hypothetical protein
MSATDDLGTLFCAQDLPVELLRLVTTTHTSDDPNVASMLSGLVTARQHDEVICPLMVQRRLVVPSHYDSLSPTASRIG